MQHLTLLILVCAAVLNSAASEVVPAEHVDPAKAESALLFFAKNSPDQIEDNDDRTYLRNRHNIHEQRSWQEDRNINEHGVRSEQQKIIDRVYSPDYTEPKVILDYRYLKSGGRDYVRGPGGQIIILPKGIRSDEHKEHDNYDSLIEYLRIKNLGKDNRYNDVSQNGKRRDDGYNRRDDDHNRRDDDHNRRPNDASDGYIRYNAGDVIGHQDIQWH